jgi:lantibiotic modifying enzyme
MRGALAPISPFRGRRLIGNGRRAQRKMGVTEADLESIVRSVSCGSSFASDSRLRRMLVGLSDLGFSAGSGTPLRRLCSAGVAYGWNELTNAAAAHLFARITTKARTSLRTHLLRTLEQITRPSLELEWESFVLAMNSLGLRADPRAQERMFLRDRPSHRLFFLFKKFPMLACLWSLAIRQWQDHVVEVFDRFAADEKMIVRTLFGNLPAGRIKDLRPGLSDPHNGGRSVTLIVCEGGRVIYKPRSGTGESSWFELITWMNRHRFQPELQAARVLLRRNYHWMEHVEATSCRNQAAVRRFYTRLGGMIAVAYLLKAVDCHRENVIAAGEQPVLVDVDALWHVSPVTRTQSLATVLYQTGFFPSSKRRSLQSRSCVLGGSSAGKHLARIAGRATDAGDYTKQIIGGFSRAWNCLMATSRGRSFLLKKLCQIRRQPRRWIYLATETYGAILRASVAPSALQSEEGRKALIARLCSRSSIKPAVIRAEVRALSRLDLPYFVRKTNELMPSDKNEMPSELADAIQSALLLGRKRRLKRC